MIALFDFNTVWFTSPCEKLQANQTVNDTGSTSSLQESIGASASLLATAVNTTAEAVMNITTSRKMDKASSRSAWSIIGVGWLREAITKGELRIDCLNTVIRL